ncbi:murein biosynthesis integral membrane protein MurJ [Alphaproteobacteria bacterium LSUCC0684]
MSSGKSLFGAVRQIGGLTALSRILGFMRDILLAVVLGGGPVADAFFVAFKLPNLFRRMTAEGAMTNAFLPAYAKAEKESPAAARRLAEEVQITLLWALVLITIVMELAMPLVITFLAPGFTDEGGRFETAVLLARITMPYLPMISLVALWAAITNASNHFFGGAAAPVLLNLVLMAGAVMAGLLAGVGAVPVAVAVPVAGLFQMVLLQRMLVRVDRLPRWMILPRISDAGRRMWRSFFSAAIGAGGMQINLLVDTILASLLPIGAISALYFADRIAQLPLGIIGIALGTALLPQLSRLEASGDGEAVIRTMGKAIYLGMFFALPAMAGAICLAEEIIGGLFAYGAFDPARITPVAEVLIAYGVGIPAFILAKIMQPAFYAAHDPKTPLKISFATILINLVASLLLMRVLGAAGLALATALASWVSVLVMGAILNRRGRLHFSSFKGLGRIALISLAMAAVIIMSKGFVLDAVAGIPFGRTFGLAGLVLIGGAVYFGLAGLAGALPREVERAESRA